MAASLPKFQQEFATNQKKDLPIKLTKEECNGKTYIVTGATGGLGFECVKHLVALDAAKVIIAVRSQESGNTTKTTIETETGRQDVIDVWSLDLASYDSVKAFAKKTEELDRIDAIVLNAGALMATWEEKEGAESNITINFFSNFLLTFLIFPHLEAIAKKHDIKPRVVVVGSMGAFVTEPCVKMMVKPDTLEDLNNREKWESQQELRYAFSKLLEHFAVREMASHLPVSQTGIILNVVDPGLCKTNLTRNTSFFTSIKTWLIKALLGRTAEMGSRTLLHGISEGEESHGKYLTSCDIREDHIPEFVTNEDGKAWQVQVWAELLEKLEQIQPGCVAAVIKN
ncbi:Short chain dehydrogenase FGM9 [Cladobotryum mycophilum]|uniref:Short chain dehydrogenase FGM9 n=1 Tax=Cladobotryum mycophilum TaxID=491253 RepID=A0ABR0SHS1_9HYPO